MVDESFERLLSGGLNRSLVNRLFLGGSLPLARNPLGQTEVPFKVLLGLHRLQHHFVFAVGDRIALGVVGTRRPTILFQHLQRLLRLPHVRRRHLLPDLRRRSLL